MCYQTSEKKNSCDVWKILVDLIVYSLTMNSYFIYLDQWINETGICMYDCVRVNFEIKRFKI